MNPAQSGSPSTNDPRPAAGSQPLWSAEFSEIGSRIADLARSGLPLVAGLRALSEELPSLRMRKALLEISGRIERGASLESAFHDTASVPDDIAGIIRAGLQSGNLAGLLEQFLQFSRSLGDRRRRVVLVLAYPGFVILIGLLILAFFLGLVGADFQKIFAGFGVELPNFTRSALWLATAVRNGWLQILLTIIVAALGTCGALRYRRLRRIIRRTLYYMPLIGPMARYASLSAFCNVLALLVEHDVALPEALRAAAASTRDAALQADTQRVAAELERGTSLEQAGRQVRCYPEYLLHTFRWEQNQRALGDGLRSVGEVFSIRADSQAELIGTIAEPAAIVAAAAAISSLVIAIFLPLFKLLSALS